MKEIKIKSKYLSEELESLPCGRIDKRYTGIGATTLEINDQTRNSIIVVPTRALAATKAVNGVFYLGGEYNNRKRNDFTEIENNTTSGDTVKIMAVADSFVSSFNKNSDFYLKNFHLVLDEIDSFQSESSYRRILESCIDIYKLFPPENRTMISATIQDFSDEELKNEPITKINKENHNPIPLNLYLSNGDLAAEVAYLVETKLSDNSNGKILIAYNNIKEIIRTGAALNNKYTIGILCSNQSSDKIPNKWLRSLTKRKLQDQVTFITSAYFVGVDIEEDGTVIVVGDPRLDFTILTEAKIQQCIGRLRGKVDEAFFIFKTNKDSTNLRTYKTNLKREIKNHLKTANSEKKLITRKKFPKESEYDNAIRKIISKHTFVQSNSTLKQGIRTLHYFDEKIKKNNLALDYLIQQQTANNELYRYPAKTYRVLSESTYYNVSKLEKINIKIEKDQEKNLNVINQEIKRERKNIGIVWVENYFTSYNVIGGPEKPKTYKTLIETYEHFSINHKDSSVFKEILLYVIANGKNDIDKITNRIKLTECWHNYELENKLKGLFNFYDPDDKKTKNEYHIDEVQSKISSILPELEKYTKLKLDISTNNKLSYFVKKLFVIERKGRKRNYRFLRPLNANDILCKLTAK